MKVKDFIAAKLGLQDTSNLVIIRTGGWVKDNINPTYWPGGKNAPTWEVFDPSFDNAADKFYVIYAEKNADGTLGEHQRLEINQAEIGGL